MMHIHLYYMGCFGINRIGERKICWWII